MITATVSASGSVEARAKQLGEVIERKAKGKSVNIIAHSMVIILRSVLLLLTDDSSRVA